MGGAVVLSTWMLRFDDWKEALMDRIGKLISVNFKHILRNACKELLTSTFMLVSCFKNVFTT